MPKRKRTTALFDVMSIGKAPAPLIRSRSWLQSPSWTAIFHRAKSSFAPKAPRPRESQAHFKATEPAPEPAYIEPKPIAPEKRAPRDPWFRRFSFNWDATNTTIVASGVVIVVGLTFLIVHKFQHESLPTLAALSSPQNRQVVRTGVLDVSRRPAQPPPQLPSPQDTPPAGDTSGHGAALPAERIINMNYVLIQIYDKEQLAHDAADQLIKNGVDCTVSQGLPRWAGSKWYCIVGTKGFGPRTSGTAEFENYVEKIREVGNTFAGKSKWKQFNPQLYRWGADNEK